jgi:endonuclease-3
MAGAPLLSPGEIADFYRRLAERTPNPETELEFVNDFTLLVAVVLSAQATDASVKPRHPATSSRVSTPAQDARVGERAACARRSRNGLFNTKART